jgi:hypothetical protein
MRDKGESFSDVIQRLIEIEAKGRVAKSGPEGFSARAAYAAHRPMNVVPPMGLGNNSYPALSRPKLTIRERRCLRAVCCGVTPFSGNPPTPLREDRRSPVP